MSWKTLPVQLLLGNPLTQRRKALPDQPEEEAGDPAESELCDQVEGTQARTRGLHSHQGWA